MRKTAKAPITRKPAAKKAPAKKPATKKVPTPKKIPAKRGATSKKTETICAAICERLTRGDSLRAICKSKGMPDKATICRWLESDPAFRDQYTRAREAQAEMLADEITDIADQADAKTIRGIEHARLRIDARKWVAAKLLPKKYSDKVVQEITGKDGGSLRVHVDAADALKDLSDEQLAQLEAIAAALAGSGGNPGGAGAPKP